METLNEFTMNKSNIVQSPKDCILPAVITRVDKGLLQEFLGNNIDLTKWSNLDAPFLLIHFETKFEDRVIGGTDRIAFYEQPLSGTNLGKALEKYGSLNIGTEIKVIFDGKGFSSIVLE